MKNTRKRWLAVFLTMLLTASMTAGCNQESGSNGTDTVNGQEASEGSEVSAYDGTLQRLVPEGEEVTLSIWKPTHTTIGTRIEDWGDAEFNQWYEEQTGVKIDWITPVGGTEMDNLAMLISSGEYPDIFSGAASYYNTGAYGLMKDGVVINVAEHLDKLPNYKAQLEMSDLRQKESYSDNGELSSFTIFSKDDQPTSTWYGILMRKDYLDAVGMDVPETYDEWYDVLVAFRDQLGLTKPYVLNYDGFPKLNAFIGGLGFGYMSNMPFYQIDGTVYFAPLSDGFRTYLEMMNKWYTEGLIDPDFMSMNSSSAEMATYSDPMTGSMVAPTSLAPVLKALIGDESVEYVAVPNPVVNKGDKVHIYPYNATVSTGYQISTQCDNLDIALQWCDLQYSDDIIFKGNWGIDEGNYVIEDDGNVHFSDRIFKNEDGFSAIDMIYSIAPGPVVVDQMRDREDDPFLNEAAEMYDSQCDNEYTISAALTMTDEENEIYNSVITEVMTYVQEMQVKFILGIESFDQYDAFLEKIREMGIDQAIAAYQAAFDRYNAR